MWNWILILLIFGFVTSALSNDEPLRHNALISSLLPEEYVAELSNDRRLTWESISAKTPRDLTEEDRENIRLLFSNYLRDNSLGVIFSTTIDGIPNIDGVVSKDLVDYEAYKTNPRAGWSPFEKPWKPTGFTNPDKNDMTFKSIEWGAALKWNEDGIIVDADPVELERLQKDIATQIKILEAQTEKLNSDYEKASAMVKFNKVWAAQFKDEINEE